MTQEQQFYEELRKKYEGQGFYKGLILASSIGFILIALLVWQIGELVKLL